MTSDLEYIENLPNVNFIVPKDLLKNVNFFVRHLSKYKLQT